MKTRLTFVHAISPLHAGTGQGVGAIDLPIARERATKIPFLPGSSVKGTLRDQFNHDPDKRDRIFGPESTDSNSFAGAIQFSDQTLLCLPVRSLAGSFAYVTSPYVLRRLRRDANVIAQQVIPDISDEECVVTSSCAIKLTDNQVCLEDLDLTLRTGGDDWANWLKEKLFDDADWRQFFADHFCIVSDTLFSFLMTTGTEVSAKIKLQADSKTTVQGALWYEECLPSETILFGLALSFPNSRTQLTDEEIFLALESVIKPQNGDRRVPLQFGGHATTGRGLCNFRFSHEV